MTDRVCANYLPRGWYNIKGQGPGSHHWCSDEGNNAIRCTRGTTSNQEKFYVKNIGQEFNDMGDGYLQMSETVIPKTNNLVGVSAGAGKWEISYTEARDECNSRPECTAFSHNPNDWTFFFKSYKRNQFDYCKNGNWVEQHYRGHYGAGWRTYEKKELTPFYDVVAIKGNNQGKWCATDDEKSWIKCNRGGIGSYERFVVEHAGGNQFYLAGRRCNNRFCSDGGHEGIKCDVQSQFKNYKWLRFEFSPTNN